MFKNDEVCDLVQIDLTRVRKIRAALVAAGRGPGAGRHLQRPRRSDARAHPRRALARRAVRLRSRRGARLSQSAVSHQLRLLRGLRLVRPRRDGRVVFYSLDDQHIMSIFKQTLQHVEESASATRVATARQAGSARPAVNELPVSDTHASAARTAKTKRRRRPARGFAAGSPALRQPWSWRRAASAGSRRSRIGACRSSLPPPSSGRCFRPQRAWQSIKRGSLDINVLMVDRGDRRDRDPPVRRGGDGGVAVRGGAVARGAEPRSRAPGDRQAARSRADRRAGARRRRASGASTSSWSIRAR